MKKGLLLFTILMATSIISFSQYYLMPYENAFINPGSINADNEYPVGGGLDASWITLQGPSATPVWSATQSLPFSFSFNGSAVTQYKVSTSGVLTFDVGTALAAPSYTKSALPNATIPNASVCIWGLSGLGANDNIVTKTFGSAPNRQHWIQFSSYSYGATTSDGSNFTYWSIVLDETTNTIHIVDNRTGGYATTKKVSAGIQLDASNAITIPTSPDLVSLAQTDPTAADNSYYSFLVGTRPNYDLAVKSVDVPSYITPGNQNIIGAIKNYGAATITSFTINYKIDGGTAVSAPVTGTNIATFGTYNFTSSIPWNAIIGSHTVEAYATNINGNVDVNTSNDSKTSTVNVLSEIVQRIPLLEVYTSSTCGPCTGGNQNLHSIIDTKPASEYVVIKFQQDFPSTGDPYCTTEGYNRRNYYAINSIPRMETDGGWDGNANSFTQVLYDEAKAKPAQFKMSGTYGIDGNTKTVSGKVKYSPLFNATGAKLYIAIIENKTTQNVKTNGETEFLQVMKKMLPTEAGTILPSIAVGNWDSTSFSFSFKGNYRLPANGQTANRINHAIENSLEEFGDLRVVAWIQSGSANKQVFQAYNLVESYPTGIINEATSIEKVDIYPNPSNDVIHVSVNIKNNDNVTAFLVDAKGEVVKMLHKKLLTGKNTIDINSSTFASGVYYLTILDSKNNSTTHQVLIAH